MKLATVSVPSNIAEGQGRDSEKSFVHFVNQPSGSLYELETQLELARNLGMVPAKGAEQLLAEAAEIERMLHGLRTTLRRDAAENLTS